MTLKVRLKKLEEKLKFNKKIDPKKEFLIIIKILSYKDRLDEDGLKDKISPEEWEWYVNHRYKTANERGEDLEKVKKEIEEYKIEIEKNGGFVRVDK